MKTERKVDLKITKNEKWNVGNRLIKMEFIKPKC